MFKADVYPKTVKEVHDIEKDFMACSIDASDYILLTTQIKMDILAQEDIHKEELEKKIQRFMKKIHTLIRSKKSKYPYLKEKYLPKP